MTMESDTVKETTTTEYPNGDIVETTVETTTTSDQANEAISEIVAEEIDPVTDIVAEPVLETAVAVAEIEANKEITIAAIQAETTVELAELRKEEEQSWQQNSEIVQELQARILSLETSLAKLTGQLILPQSEPPMSPQNNPASEEGDPPEALAVEPVAKEPEAKPKRKWRLI